MARRPGASAAYRSSQRLIVDMFQKAASLVLRLTRVIAAAPFAIIALSGCAIAEPSDQGLADLVNRMSAREKLGQLNQVAGGRSKSLNSRLNAAMLERIRQGEIGSLLHVAGAKELRNLQRVAVEESKHGIPLLFAMDVVHGYKTILPAPIGIASTFDPDAARAAARIAAIEATSAGLNWTFAPMIDVARDPRWGRIVEGAGSDPYLVSTMARAQVEGFQGSDLSDPTSILATAKHFGAYGAAAGGRDYDSADISARSLNEIYLPPFYAAMSAGAGAFMTAFNDINGVPTTANRSLIEGVLRNTWSFDGAVVSDWNAIAELINHGVAKNMTEAGSLALSAGVDIDMTSRVYFDHLAEAVKEDARLAAQLDEAVMRVLKLKRRLGLFDDPYRSVDSNSEIVEPPPAHRRTARDIAAKSIVLLKNEGGFLPVKGSPRRIAVIGALADDASSQLASWRARGEAKHAISFLSAIRKTFPQADINYAPSVSTAKQASSIRTAAEAARRSDLVLLFLGEHFDFSGEARSRSSIALPDGQLQLARAVFATERPVVAILTGGRPLAIEEVAEKSDAVLATWYLGTQAGPALASVLTGAAAPGGKLPLSFPRRTGQIPKTYDHFNRGRPANPNLDADSARYMDLPITPLYSFGHGLSYSTFRYSNLRLSEFEISREATVTVQFTITNSGERYAEETPQLYIRDAHASIARPVKQLRGFHRVGLDAQQSAVVAFELSANQFAYFGANGKWIVEPGVIELMIGASSADIRLVTEIMLLDAATYKVPAPAIASNSRVIVSQAEARHDALGAVKRISEEINKIIPAGAEIELLGSGFAWAEGPVWVDAEQALYFNDVPKDRMYRWDEKEGVRLFLSPSGGARERAVSMREPGANGMAVSASNGGELLIADHGARAVSIIDLTSKRRETVTTHYQGRRFNSPNDIAVLTNGNIYFTDPPYGLRGLNDAKEKELEVNGVYFLSHNGEPIQAIASLSFPNGVAASPDEKKLYVSNSDRNAPVVTAYDIGSDGGLSAPSVVFDASPFLTQGDGLPDGMAIASNGVMFLTGPEGVYVLSAAAQLLGVIETGAPISNCALDAKEEYLYLTASSHLARVRVNIRP